MQNAMLALFAASILIGCSAETDERGDRQAEQPDAVPASEDAGECLLAHDVPCVEEDPDDCCTGGGDCHGLEHLAYDLQEECKIGKAVHSCYRGSYGGAGHAGTNYCTEDGRYGIASPEVLPTNSLTDMMVVKCSELDVEVPPSREWLDYPDCE